MSATTPTWLVLSVIVLLGALGCSKESNVAHTPASTSALPSATAAPADKPSPTSSPTKSSLTEGRVVVTASDALSGGLPAVGFTAQWSKSPGFLARMPLSGGMYLGLSGPPGGPLNVSVTAYKKGEATHDTLEKNVSIPQLGHTMGPAETVMFAGSNRPAVAYLFGKSISKTHGCAILVAAKPGATEGLVVSFNTSGVSVTQPSCPTVLAQASFAELVRSFSLR